MTSRGLTVAYPYQIPLSSVCSWLGSNLSFSCPPVSLVLVYRILHRLVHDVGALWYDYRCLCLWAILGMNRGSSRVNWSGWSSAVRTCAMECSTKHSYMRTSGLGTQNSPNNQIPRQNMDCFTSASAVRNRKIHARTDHGEYWKSRAE